VGGVGDDWYLCTCFGKSIFPKKIYLNRVINKFKGIMLRLLRLYNKIHLELIDISMILDFEFHKSRLFRLDTLWLYSTPNTYSDDSYMYYYFTSRKKVVIIDQKEYIEEYDWMECYLNLFLIKVLDRIVPRIVPRI
jgi:hypothetical protein